MTVKTVLLGKGGLAIQIATWLLESPNHELVAVVPVANEPDWLPSLQAWARQAGVAVVESGRYRDLPEPAGGRWDLALSVFYDRIIRRTFIDKCARILNVHNGPLPRYRGVRPINWALKNGETSHGVTLHEISPGVDDGPIVAQVNFSVHPQVDEVSDVYQRCLDHAWLLVRDTLPNLDAIMAIAQDETLATFYHSRDNHQLGERSTLTRADWHADQAAMQAGAPHTDSTGTGAAEDTA